MLQPKHISSLLLILLLLLEADTTSIKWHSAGAPFGNPAAWLDNYLPCVHDLVVFPGNYPAVLPLPADISVQGFQLPRDGAMFLASDATINLVTPKESGRGLNPNCESSEKRAYLGAPKTSKWFDPNSWSVNSVVGSNSDSGSAPYIPELERVPCDDELVVIPANNAPISFDLEHVHTLRLGQLIMSGSSLSRTYLQELMSREVGQLLFHNAEGVQVDYYRGEVCGCHSQPDFLIQPVCENVECPVPHCESPIRPLGSCCLLCGAQLLAPVANCLEEQRKQVFDYFNAAILKEDRQDELQLHVSHVNNRLQVILLDRDSYSERSTALMHCLQLESTSSRVWKKMPQVEVRYAGRPYNPNISFGSVLLILFCVVLVAIVTVIILAHFMPENPHLRRIPQWINDPRRGNWLLALRRNLIFNRFDEAAVSGPGSGVERLAVIGYDAESGEVRERSFNNPMFEQEEVEAEATTAATTPATIKPDIEGVGVLSPNVETGELDSCSVEEQELTEIHLESSEAESDEEAETKE
ncbi:protein amnionless [Drosophila nasuta]|uniref:protein amnionless n=1 Tax=Drosophila nasuta TaxID=42062 RepID=UPI00295E76A1|nr:protein amnionless [Drosophila nasuta]